MTNQDTITVHDVHYAQISPLADAIGKLPWPAQIVWFHNFGLTHIGEKLHLLRIGLPEPRAGGQPVYQSLHVSIYAPGGNEIAQQEFPFNNYDSGKPTAAKQLSLAHAKEKYSFVVGAGASGATPRDAADSDLRRLDTLCTAICRWGLLMSGGQLPQTQRHQRSRTVEEPTGEAVSPTRKAMSTDPDNIVVLDDDTTQIAHDHVRV